MSAAPGTVKLYKNLVDAVARTLQQVFEEKRYADKAVERVLKAHTQWGSRDRRFVAEAVYDIVRNFRLYSTLAGNEKNYWFITAVWLVSKEFQLPAWPEFRDVDPGALARLNQQLVKDAKFRYSYPDWLWQLAESELGGERWEQEAAALHEQAELVLRANDLKTTREALIEALNSGRENAFAVHGTGSAVVLRKRENIFQNKLFREGWFEVQDAGSQLISEFAEVAPGMFVVDACAGAGGKSLHLAALMKNRGRIVSMDVESWKLDELKKRARRAGAHCIETKAITGSDVVRRYDSRADRLLLDVPCSGLGVLKRNPDTKWKLSPEAIARTRELQAKILEDYSAMVKKDGLLIYSTCSVLPSENNEQIGKFLDSNASFRQIDEQMLWPSAGFDGFYMAKLRRVS